MSQTPTSQSGRIHCSIVSPHGSVVDQRVTDITVPAYDGLVGILAGHAPMLCELGIGIVYYRAGENTQGKVFVDGGFLHVCNNEVTILTRQALSSKDVNAQQVNAQLQEAENMPKDNPALRIQRQKAIRRCKYLLELVQATGNS